MLHHLGNTLQHNQSNIGGRLFEDYQRTLLQRSFPQAQEGFPMTVSNSLVLRTGRILIVEDSNIPNVPSPVRLTAASTATNRQVLAGSAAQFGSSGGANRLSVNGAVSAGAVDTGVDGRNCYTLNVTSPDVTNAATDEIPAGAILDFVGNDQEYTIAEGTNLTNNSNGTIKLFVADGTGIVNEYCG